MKCTKMKRNKFTIRFFKIVLISFLFAEANCQIYLDSTASIDERVEDLLGRMNLAEKIGQMTPG